MRINVQEPIKVEKVVPKGDLLSIEEIFYTLQGEGPFSGEPACFVRLAGCNLKCSFCDTFFSSHIPFTLDEVVDKAKEVTPGHIKLCVVTGGEPFRQFMMPFLVRKLLDRFETVQIETSGSCFQPAFWALAWEFGERLCVVCSPKTVKLHKEIVPLITAYKYVVRAGHVAEDGLPDEEPQQFKKTPVARPEPNWTGGIPPIYISPWDEYDGEKNAANIKAAVESCFQHGYKMSLQVQKIVNLP
jgi:organic radical activating enzyme